MNLKWIRLFVGTLILRCFTLRYGLAVMHFWLMVLALSKIWNFALMQSKYGENDRQAILSSYNLWSRVTYITYSLVSFIVSDVLLPVCVFIGLYGKSSLDLSGKQLQYSIAASIIIMSRRFMISIAKFPAIGGKVYMLTKVIILYWKLDIVGRY